MRLVDPQTGITVIPTDECLQLLATKQVGRLIITGGGEADVFPVNYRLVEKDIVIRTAEGTKWSIGPRGRAAFEVDDLDEATRSGWSVVAHGRLEQADELADDDLGIDGWSPHAKPHLMRLRTDTITGRRLAG